MGEYSARALHGNRSWVNLAGLAHQGFFFNGEVSERSKEHAWKVCVRQNVPRVRIPPSPPFTICYEQQQADHHNAHNLRDSNPRFSNQRV